MKNRFFFKNKLKIALMAPAVCLSLILTSCEKEVLELMPYNALTEETAFTTPERINLAVVGIYDAAQSGFYAGTTPTARVSRGYPFGAAHVEQGDNRGEDMLNLEAFYAITYESTYNAASANNQYHFETLYGVINQANVVIEGLQNAVASNIITADVAQQYEAEARFLRALSHHELLVHFARPYNHTPDASHLGVPYRTVAVNTPARVEEVATAGRNTVKEGYDLLLADLNFAEENLPETRTNQISRATQGAAIALKTRVLLHKNDWAGVIEEGRKLVPEAAPFVSPIGGYSLTASPEEPFINAFKGANNSEAIFYFENTANDNSGVNGSLGQMYNAGTGGRALVAISPVIWNSTFWPANDARRDITVSTARAIYTSKYSDAATQTDWSPIVRYAEVMLNVAEAIARTEGNGQALELLNAVRGRSTDQLYAGLSGDELVQAIINERRVEFLAEGLRWKDIHRLAAEGKFGPQGIPAKVASANLDRNDYKPASGEVRAGALTVPAIPYDDFRFIWPIPVTETNANPTLAAQQNPGY